MDITVKEGKKYTNISNLKGWDLNPRTVTQKGFERLKKQLLKLGQHTPLIIKEDGTVMSGNMRLRAMQDMGLKDIWVELIPKDKEQLAIDYALSANDRVGKYEGDQLANLIGNFPEVEWGDYSVDIKEPELVSDLMDSFKEVEEDEAPAVETGPAESKLGEVYQLGRHRVMCGDSTKIEDVEKLMDGKKADMVFTDPPYGIEIVGGNGKVGAENLAKNRVYSEVIGDDTTDTAKDCYNTCTALGIDKFIIWGGNYFTDFLPFSTSWIIWDKRGDMNSNNFADGEMAWTNIKTRVRIYKQIWNGMIREGEHENRVHPTQKPIKVLSDILKDFSGENETVADLFLGSGSTLIACEQTNRTCYGMELDPHYVDVIRKRYDNFVKNRQITGK